MINMMPTPTGAQQRWRAAPQGEPPPSQRLKPILDPHAWAQQTFGAVDLADTRRSKRLVHVAEQMASDPGASLPKQLGGTWGN